MMESMSAVAPTAAEEQFAKELWTLVARMRRHPPRFVRLAPPIDVADVMEHCTGGLYDGFEEDVKRMRHGLAPLGPRE